MALIQVEHLEKKFKAQNRVKNSGIIAICKNFFFRKYQYNTALSDVSFSINKGEIVGYIGPNGAGKSTTIKLMCGILVPDSGTVTVNGLIPYRNRKENAKNIGVVFGQRTQLWWDLPVMDSFNMLKFMYKIDEEDFKSRIDMFDEILDLNSFINTPVRNLSLGQKMRAEICAAFLHNPPIVFLDEPTIGLDIVAKRKIRDFIIRINRSLNITIILTTHDIADIESLCSRVILIDKGTKLFDNTLQSLKNQFGMIERIFVSLLTDQIQIDIISEDIYKLDKSSKVMMDKGEGQLINEYNKQNTNHNEILSYLFKKNLVKDFVIRETSLEDIIHDLYLHKSATEVIQ